MKKRDALTLSLKNKVRRNEFLRRNELLWNALRSMYRFMRYYPPRMFGRLKRENTLLYIDPNAVAYTISRDDETLNGNVLLRPGTVSPGDWDLKGHSIHDYRSVYAILKQRIENKAEYRLIPEFSQNLKRIKDGISVDGCTTEEEYLHRWRKIDELYQRIERDGYKIQAELRTSNLLNEVRIQIGRKGELLLETGLSRLVIAQLLGLDQIPVVVSRYHQEWDALRQAIIKIVVQRGFFHQPFNHPDLDMIPQLYGNFRKDRAMYGNERWDYIVDSLPVTEGTVLDIGSYFGYFAHRFEDLGFDCYAVEPDKENLDVLKRYRQMRGKRFTVWEKSLFDIEYFEFDIVLALNIFHHLVKTKHDYERLVEFLRRLRCQAMYFEPQRTSKQAYQGFTDEEFIEFVISNSMLKHSRWLGYTKEERDVYLLTV